MIDEILYYLLLQKQQIVVAVYIFGISMPCCTLDNLIWNLSNYHLLNNSHMTTFVGDIIHNSNYSSGCFQQSSNNINNNIDFILKLHKRTRLL